MKFFSSVLNGQNQVQLFRNSITASCTQVSKLATKAAESDVFSTGSNVPGASTDTEFDITSNIPDAEESIEKEEKFR